MATNPDFDKTPLSNEPFSHLLDDSLPFGGFVYPSSSMLCFEKYRGNGGSAGGVGGVGVGVGGDSLSASSSNNSSSSTNISKSKRNRGGEVNTEQSGSVESKKMNKKTKTTNPTVTKTVKVRKEKLGERITALQQLVSPFGKTDTASVLHEAMGYIRFLHDQVQVLSSPYLQSTQMKGEMQSSKYDLRSRGLCLVPVECTAHVASSNGADFWSPAAMGNSFGKH